MPTIPLIITFLLSIIHCKPLIIAGRILLMNPSKAFDIFSPKASKSTLLVSSKIFSRILVNPSRILVVIG